MCYPVRPLVSLRDLAIHRRWYAFQAPIVVERVEEAARGGGGGGSVKQCLCSPTRHPGSFRCRQHHAEYVWVGGSERKRHADNQVK